MISERHASVSRRSGGRRRPWTSREVTGMVWTIVVWPWRLELGSKVFTPTRQRTTASWQAVEGMELRCGPADRLD